MLELSFTAQDLAYTRFGFSPLWEVIASVRVLKKAPGHVLHERWAEQVRPRLQAAALEWRLLSDLVPVPTRVIPAFVCPPPSTTAPDIEVELAAVRATSPERVRLDLDDLPWARSPALTVLYEDPGAGLEQLTGIIRAYWELALAPYWPRIRTLLEGDVLYRARQLAEGGADKLLNDLDPSVAWNTDMLSVSHPHVSATMELNGRGLLLVPSAFIWPRVFSVTSLPWQPTVRYPPRGVATLWEYARQPLPDALAAVIGRSRTRLLVELESPASTTELARRTGLSAGGVSQHLTALRAAGLAQAHRAGRFVHYARTSLAESLLASSTPLSLPPG